MLQTNRREIKFVYDLPYTERMTLCQILDQNDKWEILGGQHMNFDMLTIQTLRREVRCGRSATDELLTRWGHQNHTILELFVHLSKMQHYQAMMVIKKFVDVEYHRLIYEGEANLSRFFKDRTVPTEAAVGGMSLSKTHASMVNYNQSNSSNVLPAKMEGFRTPFDSESKILNVDAAAARSRANSAGSEALSTVVSNINNNHPQQNGNQQAQPTRGGNSPTMRAEHSRSKVKTDMSIGVETVGLPMISFKELEIATNGWDPHNILGKGGFGTVYKGLWKNTPVAVKRTRDPETDDEHHTVQMQQILGELRMLNSYRHDNILPLYGYSIGGEDPCLIYQFMPHGSLEDRLFCRQGTAPLSWAKRLNIAVGTARGLQFLHTINEKPLIHGDIKSANILLDSEFKPKIGDFGLAREGPHSHYTHMKVSRVHGTRPYLPDEFLRAKKFSTKVDTHSFGIVMFELATGLRAYDAQRTHKFLRDLIEGSTDAQLNALIDKKAGPEESLTFSSLLELGKCCVNRKPKDRPEMVVVLQELEAIAVQRDQMVRAQQLVQRNSLTPSTPYEIQLLHDHLSQLRNQNASPVLRNLSPSPDSNGNHPRASPRTVSPAGSNYVHSYVKVGIAPSGASYNQCVPNITVTPTSLSSAKQPISGDLPSGPAVPLVVHPDVAYNVRRSSPLQGLEQRIHNPVPYIPAVVNGEDAPYVGRPFFPTTFPVSVGSDAHRGAPSSLLPSTLPGPMHLDGAPVSPVIEDEEDVDSTASFIASEAEHENSGVPIEESQYSYILPLISELGIKKSEPTKINPTTSITSQKADSTVPSASQDSKLVSGQQTGSTVKSVRQQSAGQVPNKLPDSEHEDCRSRSQQDAPSSTNSKPLWILGESG